MKNRLFILLLIPLLLVTTACSRMTHEEVGTVTGAMAGGLAGSAFGGGSGQTVAIATGVLLGAYLGGELGRYMDRQDRLEAMRYAVINPLGEPHSWDNQYTHYQFTVKPIRQYYPRHRHRLCREFVVISRIHGGLKRTYGHTCRRRDGTWVAIKMDWGTA